VRWGAIVALTLTIAMGVAGAVVLPASGVTVYTAAPEIVHRDYVRRGGVDYARLAKRANHLAALRRGIVDALDKRAKVLTQRSSESDSLAFWINAYNMLTIDLIVREWVARKGRLKSIKDIPDAWSRPKWTVLGRSLTLDQIEHDILRKEFREPRIHFALVCASKSCPALRPTEFRAEFLDAQLDSAAREFVLDPSRNDFTPRGGAIRISKIFDWYEKDFVGVYSDATYERLYGKELGAVLAYVGRFLPAETVSALRAKRVRVKYLPYDWSLNISPPAPASPR
jgi:hypothetical protein